MFKGIDVIWGKVHRYFKDKEHCRNTDKRDSPIPLYVYISFGFFVFYAEK